MRIGQVKDFLANMMRAAAGLCTGELHRLESQEKLARLNICKKCPDDKFDIKNYQCRECGCKGAFLKLKASVNLWKCPLGHWDNLPEVELESPWGYCIICEGIIVNKDAEGILICSNGHKCKNSK